MFFCTFRWMFQVLQKLIKMMQISEERFEHQKTNDADFSEMTSFVWRTVEAATNEPNKCSTKN